MDGPLCGAMHLADKREGGAAESELREGHAGDEDAAGPAVEAGAEPEAEMGLHARVGVDEAPAGGGGEDGLGAVLRVVDVGEHGAAVGLGVGRREELEERGHGGAGEVGGAAQREQQPPAGVGLGERLGAGEGDGEQAAAAERGVDLALGARVGVQQVQRLALRLVPGLEPDAEVRWRGGEEGSCFLIG